MRLDEVDPVSGEVKSRAEVPFTVPVEVAVPLPPPAPAASPSQIAAAPSAALPPARPGAPPAQGAATSASGSTSNWAAGTSSPSESGEQQVASVGNPRDLGANTVVIPDVTTAIVSHGDNLWRISQRIYGRGTRFTVIYSANQAQIRNPNLIYPGQVFVLPQKGEKAER